MKRIVYFLKKVDYGGIERMVIDLFKYAEKRASMLGWEPYLVVFFREGGFLEDLKGNRRVFFLTSSKKNLKTASLSFYPKLRKLLKELNPDVLHFHGYPVDFISTFSSLGLKVKRIAHIHNFHFIGGRSRIVKYRFMSKYIDKFIYVSREVMDKVNPLYNTSCPSIEVLYNFIVPDRIEKLLHSESISRKEIGIPENGVVFCFVGRLTDNKNVFNLIKAMSYLRNNCDLYLLIVGDGKLREKLEKLSKELKLTNVIFAGATPNPFKFLKISDVFVLPSLREGLPLAHLEAMYLGLPSLISENVPSKEIAFDASLIVGTSAESIAKGMETLCSCITLRKKLSERAKAVSLNYTIDKYVERLSEIYQNLFEVG